MMFPLSKEIIHQIMFALEDQSTHYGIDLSSGKLVDCKSFSDGKIPSGYVELPQWGSSEGFRMMEQFVAVLRNSALQRELRSILFSGKGVFKNFKKQLKSHPQGEQQWYTFREKEMTRYITQWYNQLQDLCSLEQIGREPEDNEELLQDDFVLRKYEATTDKEKLLLADKKFEAERETQWPRELGLVLNDLWQTRRNKCESKPFLSLVAETIGGDFTGYIEAKLYPSHAQKTVFITSFFVLEEYRGLGIGKGLLENSVLQLKEKNILWIIFTDLVVPKFLPPCLTRLGFVDSGGGYILDVSGNKTFTMGSVTSGSGDKKLAPESFL